MAPHHDGRLFSHIFAPVSLALLSCKIAHGFHPLFTRNTPSGLAPPAMVNAVTSGTRRFSDPDGGNFGRAGNALWNEQVEYISSSVEDLPEGATTRSLPLFCLGGGFYPGGMTSLNVFEMKYRTMMFDIAQADDIFGYGHVNEFGDIGVVGTLCKVTERTLLDDGRQLLVVQGLGRYKVHRIEKMLPYVQAQVILDVQDQPSASEKEEEETQQLEIDVWNSLKYYMRLMRSADKALNMVVSRATKNSRPIKRLSSSSSSSVVENNLADGTRRTAFSFAVANMIQMSSSREAQLLLQTQDVRKRLAVQKQILFQATEMIGQKLVGQLKVLSPEEMESIRAQCFEGGPSPIRMTKDGELVGESMGLVDEDADIMPSDLVEMDDDEEKDEWDLSNME